MGTKTWTTTAEFETGTYTGLTTAGDELALGFSPPGAWAAGGNLNGPVYKNGGSGSQIAAISVSGKNPVLQKTTELYNGSSWSVGNDINASVSEHAVTGVQGAALSMGGDAYIDDTEEYDGTNWAIGGNLVLGRQRTSAFGLQDAAICNGGDGVGNIIQTSVEEYNGSTWATVNPLSAIRAHHGSAGLLGAGIVFGGQTIATYGVTTEEYDGTNWAAGGDVSNGRHYPGGSGTLNAAIMTGGYSGAYTDTTEEYDGTAWTNGGNLSAAKHFVGCAGDSKAGLAFGGYPGAPTNVTEEYITPTAVSGTWTIDVDGSAIVTFSSIACNIGSTVQARIKTAVNQAGLGAASWVPATGYYTAFPSAVTAAMNQWARLEFSLSGVETVQDITLSWAELLFGGNPSGIFSLEINRKLSL